MRALWLLMIAACSSKTDPRPADEGPKRTAQPGERVEHEERCPGVRAVWRGERTSTHDHYTTFSLEVAGVARPWSRELHTTDGDKPFDLFSPDCKRVLLLLTHMGPYHIVRVDRLPDYLRGAPPELVLAGEIDPELESGTGVFRGAGWTSNTEGWYLWGCCEPEIRTTFVLPSK
ncbi:MAG: hypothetical protein ACTHU0_27565 [Kofleriaceae bacterium]